MAASRFYGSNISLPSLDNLFSTEEERQDAKLSMSSERAWVYTRYHKDYIAARNRQEFLEKRARLDGYEVVGSCIDRGHYPSRRDG